MFTMTISLRAALLLCIILVQACAISPRDRISALAEDFDLYELELESAQYRHLVLRNFTDVQSGELHVYLEGDGRPWFLRYFRSSDPTPRHPMMLSLLAKDALPALYLGRPCYNEKIRSENCNTTHWTSGRYSTQIVDSMAAVLAGEIERFNVEKVTLFGHSGGGTLSLLLAEKVPQVRRVVTLAGNIDTDAWIEHHGYSRLYTSLNPAKRAPLSTQIEQIHFVAAKDVNIPPSLASAWIQNQPNSYGVLLRNFTHGCCWVEIWNDVLAELRDGAPYVFPGRTWKHPAKQRQAQGTL